MTPGDTRQHLRKDTVHFQACRETDLDENQVQDVSRVTWVGVWVNITLAAFKSVAGYLAGSSALLADAVHTISDLATDCAILIGVRYWCAPADVHHPHGHRKIETLVTLGIGVLLALVGFGMGYDAVSSLARAVAGAAASAEKPAADGFVALAALTAAFLSIVGKELLYRWTAARGVKLGSSALVANAWHHRSDAISSIPPLLAIGGDAIGSRFGYDLWYLDPIGTIIVCVMLLQAAWEVTEPTLGALLDASADRRICAAIRNTVLATKGVIDTHRIRTRVIGATAVAVDLHITVDENLSVARGHDIATNVKERILALRLDDKIKAVDVMVHVEPGDPRDERLPGDNANTRMDWKRR